MCVLRVCADVHLYIWAHVHKDEHMLNLACRGVDRLRPGGQRLREARQAEPHAAHKPGQGRDVPRGPPRGFRHRCLFGFPSRGPCGDDASRLPWAPALWQLSPLCVDGSWLGLGGGFSLMRPLSGHHRPIVARPGSGPPLRLGHAVPRRQVS